MDCHALSGTIATTMPKLIYGTAWKKERTANLVFLALKRGFRGIDTAAQPKHYHEAGVSEGVRRAIAEGFVTRADLFIQTKFTPPGDPNDKFPYDFNAPLAQKVHQSVQSSLHNFAVEDGKDSYLDCLVLHSPMNTLDETLEVWRTLETYVPQHIRNLGISNTDVATYRALSGPRPDATTVGTTVKPAVVQNRFYGETGYEAQLRQMCAVSGAVFQAFWTLLPNPSLLNSKSVLDIAQEAGVVPIAAYYSLILGLGATSVLDGTTDEKHMSQDLEGVARVGVWAESDGTHTWSQALGAFKKRVNQGIPATVT